MDGNPSIFSTAFYSLAEEPNFCCLDPDMGYWGTHGCGVMGWSNQMGKAFSQHRQYVLGETLMMGLSARLPEMKFFKIKHKQIYVTYVIFYSAEKQLSLDFLRDGKALSQRLLQNFYI